MTPLDIVAELLDGFKPKEPREEMIAQALREMVTSRTIDAATGKMASVEF